jgi:sarcosine oxidase subunit gamma
MGEDAPQSLVADGVTLTWLPQAGLVALRGRSDNRAFVTAAGRALGLPLPTTPNTTAVKGERRVYWLSPESWIVQVGADETATVLDRLRAATRDQLADMHDVADARTRFRIDGPRARDLLAKGTALDLDARVFTAGQCAQTLFAQLTVLLCRPGDAPAFELHVDRPAERYLWAWLTDAAREWRRS